MPFLQTNLASNHKRNISNPKSSINDGASQKSTNQTEKDLELMRYNRQNTSEEEEKI